jgi:hypothetical protein
MMLRRTINVLYRRKKLKNWPNKELPKRLLRKQRKPKEISKWLLKDNNRWQHYLKTPRPLSFRSNSTWNSFKLKLRHNLQSNRLKLLLRNHQECLKELNKRSSWRRVQSKHNKLLPPLLNLKTRWLFQTK